LQFFLFWLQSTINFSHFGRRSLERGYFSEFFNELTVHQSRKEFDQRTQFLRFLLPESYESMKNALSELDEAEQQSILEEFQDLAKLMSHNSEEIVINSTELTTIESPRPLNERQDATLKISNSGRRSSARDSTYLQEPSFTMGTSRGSLKG
jgi:hypothetical protein